MFLGIDTSNYTSSVALYSKENMRHERKLLTVKNGQVGLRQSDAHFQHVNNLPVLFELLKPVEKIHAIGVSTRPRNVEGSYMPVFLAGVSFAKTLGAFLNVPVFEFSHQQGHLAAALYSSKHEHLYGTEFYAWHVSGGTTELLKVDNTLNAQCFGGTKDCHAGQIVDRIGNMLGLDFPAGRQLEQLALQHSKILSGKLTVTDRYFSLSGIENQAKNFFEKNEQPSDIAQFVLTSLCYAINTATQELQNQKVLACGGVMSNLYIQSQFPQFVFSQPWASCDNAVGTAYLANIAFNSL